MLIQKQQRQTAVNEEVNDEVTKINRLIDAQKRQTEKLALNSAEYYASKRKQVELEYKKDEKDINKVIYKNSKSPFAI